MVEACLTGITLSNNPMTDTVYNINTSSLTPLLLDLPSYSPVPATCTQPIGTMPYLVTDTTYSQLPPSYMSLTLDMSTMSIKLQIQSDQATDVAPQTEYRIVAMNDSRSIMETTATFKLTMSLPCTTAITMDQNNLSDTTYYIETAAAYPAILSLPTYTITPATCTDTLTYSVHPASDTNAAAPSYITIAE